MFETALVSTAGISNGGFTACSFTVYAYSIKGRILVSEGNFKPFNTIKSNLSCPESKIKIAFVQILGAME
jgi:hypothetical protein